jgi:hypothetical protein
LLFNEAVSIVNEGEMNEYEEFCGMRIGRGNESIRRNLPLFAKIICMHSTFAMVKQHINIV